MKMMAVSDEIYKALKNLQTKEATENNRWVPITRMKDIEITLKPKKRKNGFFEY